MREQSKRHKNNYGTHKLNKQKRAQKAIAERTTENKGTTEMNYMEPEGISWEPQQKRLRNQSTTWKTGIG
jgi:hypothetical protein